MLVAHIVSVPHLDLVIQRKQGLHLILAHLCDEEPKYKEFYKKRAEAGDYIILDNSAYELGHSYPAERLFELGLEIGCKEIMAPEAFGDSKQTQDLVMDFVFKRDKYLSPTSGIGIFATICGATRYDFLQCYANLIQSSAITCVGLSYRVEAFHSSAIKHPSRTMTRALNRIAMTKSLEEYGMVNRTKAHHLLGCNDPTELYHQSYMHPWIRSCDTSTAFVHGAAGIEFLPTKGLPGERVGNIDFHLEVNDPVRIRKIQVNMDTLERMSQPDGR